MHNFALNSREALGLPSSTLHRLDRGDKLPLGIPQLMMAFTADRQAKANTKVDPGADSWQKGQALQLDLKTVSVATR